MHILFKGFKRCVLRGKLNHFVMALEITSVLFTCLEPPSRPSMKTQPLVCEVSCTQCALKCALESVTDLGPVTYEWKKDGGEWTEGDVLKNMAVCETPEVFSCRVITTLRASEGSDPKDNPCLVPPIPGTCPVDGSNRKGHNHMNRAQGPCDQMVAFVSHLFPPPRR